MCEEDLDLTTGFSSPGDIGDPDCGVQLWTRTGDEGLSRVSPKASGGEELEAADADNSFRIMTGFHDFMSVLPLSISIVTRWF